MDAQRWKVFQKAVWDYYKKNKRDLPWRSTKPNPYHILVSEMMLQQTQVGRVVGKYEEFIRRFPTVSTLARARTADVIRAWQGLGYNRRALYLHKAAQIIVKDYKNKVPRDPELLEQLPGIGHYTAHAIATFAYNEPHIFIETNIRSVYIHHFFPRRAQIKDAELLPLIEATLPTNRLRSGFGASQWYAALMDYGAHLKTQGANPSRESAHHVKQKKFKGSEREVRGALLRALAQSKTKTILALIRELSFPTARITKNLDTLKKEGLVVQRRHAYSLPN